MKYKTESKNTTQFINLHDCECTHMKYENSGLILEMEWIEVLAEHPENPYNMAHSSDSGVIELDDVIIIDYKIDYGKNSTETIKIGDSFRIDDMEIYSFSEYNIINSDYKYAEISGFSSDIPFIIIELLFKKSYVKWNNLEDISWFESKKNQKESKRIKEILKMLSCNNPEEVQSEGLKLASGIKYTGHFFQPSVDGETESLWENCALILSQKTDEDLTDYLLYCLFWIKDMNCKGADKIFVRLMKYSNKKRLNCEKNKAIKTAKIMNDNKWLDTLYKIK